VRPYEAQRILDGAGCFTYSFLFKLQLNVASGILLAMKPVRYMRHARNRMRLHAITENEIESAIRKPEFLEPLIEGRWNAWIETSGKFLRVTYKEMDDALWVITAVKKMKKWR